MPVSTDPALYFSNYERRDLDRYWTHPWVTQALLDSYPIDVYDYIWEPAAGRGDIVNVLMDYGHEVIASDVDLSDYYHVDGGDARAFVGDFLEIAELPTIPTPEGRVKPRAIVTNPPYNQPRGIAEDFVRHGVRLLRENDDLEFMAMLLRSEFCHARTRRDLFGDCREYHGEVVLTTRPRWDWWYTDQSTHSPRHNFSWFLWSTFHPKWKRPVQYFHYR